MAPAIAPASIPASAERTSRLTEANRKLFRGSAAEVHNWMTDEEILGTIDCNFNVESCIPTVDGREYPENRLWLRSDNRDHLGTFGNRRQVIQPVDFVRYFRDFCDKSGKAISLDVVGTPDNGKTFYMASKLLDANLQGLMEEHSGKGFSIQKDVDKADRTDAWLIITDYYGESSAPRGLVFLNELVCANGMTRRSESRLAGLTHLRKQNGADVSKAIFAALEEVEVYQQLKERLINVQITPEFARNCIRAFYRPTSADTASAKKADKLIHLWENELIGGDLPTRHNTAWGLLQAVTQYTTHNHIGDGEGAQGRAFKSLLDGARARESRTFVDHLQAQLAAV